MKEDWRDLLEKRHRIPGPWPCDREGGERGEERGIVREIERRAD
jgi:hypothetical protein